jgi:hypothetical protein
VAGRIRPIEKSSDLIRNRTHNLPACSIVPPPTTLLRAPFEYVAYVKNLLHCGSSMEEPTLIITNISLYMGDQYIKQNIGEYFAGGT